MYRKYRAVKVVNDYGTFDSKKEFERYKELKQLEDEGEIKNLRMQVPYQLIPTQTKADGKKERPVYYKADFVYEEPDGTIVVEDVKGFKTPEYIIKRKLMLWIHKITVKES